MKWMLVVVAAVVLVLFISRSKTTGVYVDADIPFSIALVIAFAM